MDLQKLTILNSLTKMDSLREEKEEIWVPACYFHKDLKVMLYFDKYEVSSRGRIRNVRTGQIRNPSVNNDGYYFVGCYENTGKTRTLKVHRLVASSFFGAPADPSFTVDHINHEEEKLNNSVSNLRWASPQEQAMNRAKSVKQGQFLPVVGTHMITGEKIYHPSATIPGFDQRRVSRSIVEGYSHRGYYWKVVAIDERKGEEWKAFGEFEFSDQSRIRKRHASGVYYEVQIKYHDGYKRAKVNGRYYRVHRIVEHLFRGFDLDDTDTKINHINENRAMNNVTNLEACTSAENALHSLGYVYRWRNMRTGEEGECQGQKELAKITGYSQPHVSAMTNSGKQYNEWQITKLERIADKRMRLMREAAATTVEENVT